MLLKSDMKSLSAFKEPIKALIKSISSDFSDMTDARTISFFVKGNAVEPYPRLKVQAQFV